MSVPDTQASLLIRMRDSGDTDAWQQFGDVYGPVVFRFLTSRGLQEADARDVKQDVLAEVARCIASFDYCPKQGRFRNWLATVTRRQLNRFWRSHRNEKQLEPEEMGVNASSDSHWIDAWQSEVLSAAMQRVRSQVHETTWRAFEMTWLKEMPASDVSKALNMPIDLVYSAKARTLKRLETEVQLLGDDCAWIEGSE